MDERDDAGGAHHEEIQPALDRLLRTVACELAPLLRDRRSFRVVINGSSEHTFTVEATKFVKLQKQQ